jgi:hypothetical protein
MKFAAARSAGPRPVSTRGTFALVTALLLGIALFKIVEPVLRTAAVGHVHRVSAVPAALFG